jgi:hypothetical protein
MEIRSWDEILRMVTVRIWTSDLKDVMYLSEKLLRALNRGLARIQGEHNNFFVIECEECVYKWLYNLEKPEGV